MSNQLQIVQTADGSNTIFNPQVGENYHSKNGALQESKHVFVKSGLDYFLNNSGSDTAKDNYDQVSPVSILEVGFGTGLNFLLSADYCTNKNVKLDYTGIEAFPLSLDLISQTGYDQYINFALWQSFIDKYKDSLSTVINVDENNKLLVANCKLLDFIAKHQFDIIYFDAFAAAYQPEMWDEQAITHTLSFLKPGGIFVTYAITGNLKRMVKALGCKIEKVPGAAGKREMLRAVKLDN